jgi:hypothetical protein
MHVIFFASLLDSSSYQQLEQAFRSVYPLDTLPRISSKDVGARIRVEQALREGISGRLSRSRPTSVAGDP